MVEWGWGPGGLVLTLAGVLGMIGCGARSDLSAPPPGAGPPPAPTPTSPPVPPPDCSGSPGPPPAPSCGPLTMNLGTEAACDIVRPDCAPVDAEGIVSVQSCAFCGTNDNWGEAPFEPHRVFAMSRLGAGHVIGWGDFRQHRGAACSTGMPVVRRSGGAGTSAMGTVTSTGWHGTAEGAVTGVSGGTGGQQ